MVSLWFVVALAGAFADIRILVAENAPVVDVCDHLDAWADQLFVLAPTLHFSVLAGLATLVLIGPPPKLHS